MCIQLSQNLKALRKQMAIHQKDVALALNIKQQAYSRYENGLREPDIATLIAIADFFDKPIDILVGRYQLNKTN